MLGHDGRSVRQSTQGKDGGDRRVVVHMAAWAKIGDRWVGVWTEAGFEYLFTIDEA